LKNHVYLTGTIALEVGNMIIPYERASSRFKMRPRRTAGRVSRIGMGDMYEIIHWSMEGEDDVVDL
jgi:hypothetical protein